MSTDSPSFFDAALNLPDAERAHLAFQLLQSLPAPGVCDEDEASFALEIERRAQEFEAGTASASDWEDVSMRLRDALRNRFSQ